MKANIEAGNIVPSQQYVQNHEQQKQTVAPPLEVRIDSGSEPEEDVDAENELDPERKQNEKILSRKRSSEAAEIVDEDEYSDQVDVRTEERNKRSKTPPEKRQRLGKHEIEIVRRMSVSPMAPPRSGSESPSETMKEIRVVTEWEELGGLDDDGLYVMDDVLVVEEEV